MKVISMQRNSKNCLICGLDNALGLKAPFYNLEDGSVASIFTFKTEHQSYPDRTHGGMSGALIDELMGRALWATNPEMFGVTTSLNVTYRKAVPLNTQLKARGYITFESRIGFTAKGQIYSMDNTLLIEATAKYFKMPFDKAFKDPSSLHDEMPYVLPIDITEIDFPERL